MLGQIAGRWVRQRAWRSWVQIANQLQVCRQHRPQYCLGQEQLLAKHNAMLKTTYLFNPDVKAQQRSSWLGALQSEVLVIDRGQCLHERVPLGGLSRWHWQSFAQVQVRARSAFARPGWCAVVQGDFLHLWMWEAVLEDEAARQQSGRRPSRVIASSLLGKRANTGVQWIKALHGEGVEARLWRNDQLIDSRWFEKLPTDAEWNLWRSTLGEAVSAQWPLTLSLAQVRAPQLDTWARPLLPKRKQAAPSLLMANWRIALLALISVGLISWLAFLLGQQQRIESALVQAQLQRTKKLADFENASSERQKAQERLKWLDTAAAYERPIRMYDYVEASAGVVLKLGLALRDIEVGAGVVTATVIVPPGVNFRITSVINALEREPLFYDARFVDVVAGDGFKFSWRLRSRLDDLRETPQAGGKS
jgi:hypothetical protein